jgi:hypothetical protein
VTQFCPLKLKGKSSRALLREGVLVLKRSTLRDIPSSFNGCCLVRIVGSVNSGRSQYSEERRDGGKLSPILSGWIHQPNTSELLATEGNKFRLLFKTVKLEFPITGCQTSMGKLL